MKQVEYIKLITLMVLVISLLLVVVAVPRFLAELALVPGTPIYERLMRGEKVSNYDLKVAIESRADSLQYANLARSYSDLGTLYLIRAKRETRETTRKQFVLQAIKSLEASLRREPYNTYAWLRLSSANIMLGRAKYNHALEAWRASVMVGRYEPIIALQRIHIGILIYQAMTREDARLLKQQILLAYDTDRWKLARYAKEHKLIEWIKRNSPPEININNIFTDE